MRRILVQPKFNVGKGRLWDFFVNIKNYPKIIPFCQRVEIKDGLKVGGQWVDWSTILWIPLKMNHDIVQVQEPSCLRYKIRTFFGSELGQNLILEGNDSKSSVQAEITIDLKPRLLDIFLGKLVEKRNREMIEGTIKNVRRLTDEHT
ncbi:MAG: hypothetical protein A3A57_02715 [Candidatus Woykebacteria bacterium RIFCSPLOWO2_01_FULL_41_12]|uniref:Coenzyme Q-binding protein COQ10 START domain-containing protein n=1 Tax=Candidatus Woykebacteria bacterium RIFCSPLOWO2_01_FULL_41_12 TaxID=1802604 RepID=A0A1G1WY23_9BACT|nr:MAG: hypothetical protein A3A57_02715 [Candidatus Woykebacteria bacterium RIFCSPLOWO2_01_FULL_41_12]